MNPQRKTMLLVMALAIIMTVYPIEVQAGCCCPTFWTAFGKHCYRFFGKTSNWQEAEDHCRSYTVPSLGDGTAVIDSLGHLVSIHSEAEHNFVSTLITSSAKEESAATVAWIGCHDTTTEDTFVWSDGTPYNFTMWYPGQPDDWRTGQDCTVIKSSYGNKWDDGGCGGILPYFVCKLPAW